MHRRVGIQIARRKYEIVAGVMKARAPINAHYGTIGAKIEIPGKHAWSTRERRDGENAIAAAGKTVGLERDNPIGKNEGFELIAGEGSRIAGNVRGGGKQRANLAISLRRNTPPKPSRQKCHAAVFDGNIHHVVVRLRHDREGLRIAAQYRKGRLEIACYDRDLPRLIDRDIKKAGSNSSAPADGISVPSLATESTDAGRICEMVRPKVGKKFSGSTA